MEGLRPRGPSSRSSPRVLLSFATRIRQLASETAIYGLSTIIGRLINFLLVPFYTHVFVPSEYKVVGLIYGAFVFLNIVYTYGLESSFLKFASGKEGTARMPQVFSTATMSLAASSLLLSLLIVLFPAPLAALVGVTFEEAPRIFWIYSAAILALDALSVVPFAALRLENRAGTFAALKLVNIFVNVGGNLYLILGRGWGLEAVFAANLIASAVTLVLLLPVYLRLFRPRLDRSIWRELLAFGLPFVPSGLGYALTERVSLFVLESRAPAEAQGISAEDAVGIFAAVWKLGVFMMLVVQMFRFAWQPFFLQHADDPDAKPLFARIFTVLTAGMLLVLLGISFYTVEIANLPLRGTPLIAPAYHAGLFLVPIALLSYLFQGWYYAFSAGLYIVKQTRYFVHSTFAGSIVAVAASFGLIPWLGVAGAGWANVLGYAAMALVLYVYAQRHYPISFDWRRVWTIAVLATGLFALWWSVPDLQRWWIEALLVGVFALGLFAVGVLPRDLVRRLLRRSDSRAAVRDPAPPDVARPEDAAAPTDPL